MICFPLCLFRRNPEREAGTSERLETTQWHPQAEGLEGDSQQHAPQPIWPSFTIGGEGGPNRSETQELTSLLPGVGGPEQQQ